MATIKSIEQKAKAYDEAYKKVAIRFGSNVADEIFINESEDDRIRKEIIDFATKANNGVTSILANNYDFNKWLAWLEKQGEKTSDKIVEKARTEKQRVLLTETDGSANIDWDCRSLDDVKILLKCGLEFIRTIEANKQILTDNRFGGCSFRVPTRYDKGIKQGEQKPVFEMKTPEESLGIESDTYSKIVDECIYGEPNPAWSEEDDKNLEKTIWYIEKGGELIFAKTDELISWLKSLKDRIQPKQEWNEEDEIALGDALWCCKQAASIAKDENDMGNVWYAENWLKSIRPQNTWKPSEGQLECLGYAIEKAEKDWSPLTNNRVYLTLKALKEQLLELRGSKV